MRYNGQLNNETVEFIGGAEPLEHITETYRTIEKGRYGYNVEVATLSIMEINNVEIYVVEIGTIYDIKFNVNADNGFKFECNRLWSLYCGQSTDAYHVDFKLYFKTEDDALKYLERSGYNVSFSDAFSVEYNRITEDD